MKLRHLYALVAVLWGLPIALAAAVQVFAWLAGFSWIYLFGDSPWPDSAGHYLLAVPLIAGIVVFAASLVVGYRQGRFWETARRPDRARRRGYAMLFAGLGVWLAVASAGKAYNDRQEAARQASVDREAAFEHLLDERRTVQSVRPVAAGGQYRIRIETAGARDGPYRLLWRLEEPLYRATLAEGDEHIALDREHAAFELALDRHTLAERYRDAVLETADADVLVEQDFSLELILEPILQDDEQARIPPREVDNWRRGLSGLRHRINAAIPLRFRFRSGQPVE